MVQNILKNSIVTCLSIAFLGCSGETSYALSDLNSSTAHEDNTSSTSSEETSVIVRQGLFLDAAVEGLEYTHENGDRNITGKGGRFYYNNSEKVSFHIGGLELGTASGAYIVTPREMVKGTSLLDSVVINNRVRLLLALDSDTQRFGIQISETARQSANAWTDAIDFTKSSIDFLPEIETMTHGFISQLPDKNSSREHIKKTLECAYSGAYQGAWDVPESNQSSGYVGVMVRADGGVVVMGDGQTINGQTNSVMYVIGQGNVDKKEYTFDSNTFFYYDRNNSILKQELTAVDPITGTGKHVAYDYITGSFVKDGVKGSYRASKSDATRNPAYRFTGFGNMFGSLTWTVGMIIMDFDPQGHITGKIHDVRDTTAQPKLEGTIDYLTGEVSIEVQMPGNVTYVTGNLDLSDPLVSSTLSWHDQNGSMVFGEVVVNGCQLQAID